MTTQSAILEAKRKLAFYKYTLILAHRKGAHSPSYLHNQRKIDEWQATLDGLMPPVNPDTNESEARMPKIVKILIPLTDLYYDGHSQQPIWEKAVGRTGEVNQWWYDEDDNLYAVDIEVNDSDLQFSTIETELSSIEIIEYNESETD